MQEATFQVAADVLAVWRDDVLIACKIITPQFQDSPVHGACRAAV